MPLDLKDPREGKTKNFYIRGTYLGTYINRSAGTDRRPVARRVLKSIEREIERGLSQPRASGKTFAGAAVIYLQGCRDAELPRVRRALDYFGNCAIETVTNEAVAEFAMEHYPPGPVQRADPRNATINREIVSPVSAIVKRAGLERTFRRYREPAGRIRLDTPEQIERFLSALPWRIISKHGKYRGAVRFPRAYAVFLFSTNARRGEAMTRGWPDVDLGGRLVDLGITKNGERQVAHLNEFCLVALANLPHRTGAVFGYKHSKQINDDWMDAREKAGIDGLSPHGARHVFATWLRRYQNADLKKLMEAGRWKDVKSVLRYAHVPSEEVRETIENSPLNRGKSVDLK